MNKEKCPSGKPSLTKMLERRIQKEKYPVVYGGGIVPRYSWYGIVLFQIWNKQKCVKEKRRIRKGNFLLFMEETSVFIEQLKYGRGSYRVQQSHQHGHHHHHGHHCHHCHHEHHHHQHHHHLGKKTLSCRVRISYSTCVNTKTVKTARLCRHQRIIKAIKIIRKSSENHQRIIRDLSENHQKIIKAIKIIRESSDNRQRTIKITVITIATIILYRYRILQEERGFWKR